MIDTLIIAEKKSAADTLAAWLSSSRKFALRKNFGYHEVGPYTITWMRGHLLENAEPHLYEERYKRWSAADLPIIPATWQLTARDGAGAQVKLLKDLIAAAREIIGFTDPDVEGQLLQDEFLRWASARAPVRRLWAGALDDASLEKAWATMKPNSAYENTYWQGLARSHADWLVGINLTRACTIAGRNAGTDAVLSVGRVQTPTLGLVVALEKSIRAFKPTTFFTPLIELATKPGFQASWLPQKEDIRVDPEDRLLDRKIAQKIVDDALASGKATVVSVTKKKFTEQAPLLFSLSTLQAHCARRLGMGVKETLDAVQALYDAKITSYPRTDCEYLPKSQHPEAASIVAGISSALALAGACKSANLKLSSRAFDDSKITAHHAIVPRPATSAQLAALPARERRVWEEIAKRYLLQFFPAAAGMSAEILLSCASESFQAHGKQYTARGWKDAFTEVDEEAEEPVASLPAVKKGDLLALAGARLKESTTKPPKRFNQGTLVAAMKTVHRYVKNVKLKAVLKETAGIGTEATRAGIIEELIRRRFISSEKNQIKPTALGESLYDALPSQLTEPDMTALWQQTMDEIGAKGGEPGYEKFMAAQKSWLTGLVGSVPGWFSGRALPPGPGGAKSKSTAGAGRTATKFTCEKCKSSPLAHVNGKFGWFFACMDEACKATFNDEGGKPVAKEAKPAKAVTIKGVSSGDSCPKCKSGTMQTRVCGPKTRSPGALFLSCSNYFSEGANKCTNSLWP